MPADWIQLVFFRTYAPVLVILASLSLLAGSIGDRWDAIRSGSGWLLRLNLVMSAIVVMQGLLVGLDNGEPNLHADPVGAAFIVSSSLGVAGFCTTLGFVCIGLAALAKAPIASEHRDKSSWTVTRTDCFVFSIILLLMASFSLIGSVDPLPGSVYVSRALGGEQQPLGLAFELSFLFKGVLLFLAFSFCCSLFTLASNRESIRWPRWLFAVAPTAASGGGTEAFISFYDRLEPIPFGHLGSAVAIAAIGILATLYGVLLVVSPLFLRVWIRKISDVY